MWVIGGVVLLIIIAAVVIPFVTSQKTTDEIIAEIKEAFKVYPHIDRDTKMDLLKCSQMGVEGEEGTYHFDLLLGECVQYCKPYDKMNGTRMDRCYNEPCPGGE